jgi:hypothetical protein
MPVKEAERLQALVGKVTKRWWSSFCRWTYRWNNAGVSWQCL